MIEVGKNICLICTRNNFYRLAMFSYLAEGTE